MSSYWASSPRSSAPWGCRRARTSSMSSTANMMLRRPSVFGGAFLGSALIAAGVWNFVSSSRPWPSGVRIMAMSTRTPSSALTQSTQRPSMGASPSNSMPSSTKNALAASSSSKTTLTWSIRFSDMSRRIRLGRSAPVHRRGAEVREVVLLPQAGVPGEAVAVFGPGLRGAPGLVGDAGQARKQLEGEVIEVGDGLAPDGAFDPGDLRRPCCFCAERLGGVPIVGLGDGHGSVEPVADAALPVGLGGIGRRFGVEHIEVAVALGRHDHGHLSRYGGLDVVAR